MSEINLIKNRTRNKNLALKFTSEEMKEINLKIEKSGLSKTDFILSCIREKDVVVITDITAVLSEIRKQGFNINQIAHAMNSYAHNLKELNLEVYDGKSEWERFASELELSREANKKTFEILKRISDKVV